MKANPGARPSTRPDTLPLDELSADWGGCNVLIARGCVEIAWARNDINGDWRAVSRFIVDAGSASVFDCRQGRSSWCSVGLRWLKAFQWTAICPRFLWLWNKNFLLHETKLASKHCSIFHHYNKTCEQINESTTVIPNTWWKFLVKRCLTITIDFFRVRPRATKHYTTQKYYYLLLRQLLKSLIT